MVLAAWKTICSLMPSRLLGLTYSSNTTAKRPWWDAVMASTSACNFVSLSSFCGLQDVTKISAAKSGNHLVFIYKGKARIEGLKIRRKKRKNLLEV
jgi:hypothetical protein